MLTVKPTQSLIFLAALFLLTVQFAGLSLFGQPLIAASGEVKIWEGVILSVGNSQHLSDWYTFTHIIHGILFYALTKLFFPRLPAVWRLLLALTAEVSWEILENVPAVIQHYRQQALAVGYTGDSILNSVSDSFAMMAGFCIAWRLPPWVVIMLVLGLELWLAYEVRDNLILNIINLIYAFPSIKVWQMGAGAI